MRDNWDKIPGSTPYYFLDVHYLSAAATWQTASTYTIFKLFRVNFNVEQAHLFLKQSGVQSYFPINTVAARSV